MNFILSSDCIKFIGFEPDHEFKDYLMDQLREILELAPSDSRMSFTLERKNTDYESMLFLHSLYSTFEVPAFEKNPYSAVKKIKNDSLKIIRQWKKTRFEQPNNSSRYQKKSSESTAYDD